VCGRLKGRNRVSKERLIAVVDDDGLFCQAVVGLLRSAAFSARGFASAAEFVAAGGFDLYDCIITDIQMPGMSGIELVRLLESRGFRIPVIVVTADIDSQLENQLVSSGASCLLRKPFNPDQLIACVESVLLP
jgi:FixJ family two-component response regulator